MNLKEYQEKFGIKRIDFDKVHRNSDIYEQYGSDTLICPYCDYEFNFESEEIDEILGGESYQCPECEKWFYVEGEIEVNTTCTPLEDYLLDHREMIDRYYKHSDECDKKGMDFPEKRIGYLEWETYQEYAVPLFENMKKDERE